MEFVEVVSEVTADIELGSLLKRVMGEATRMLNAERSTLFLNDEKTGELWSEVGQGLESQQIRLPNHLGIAGAVFTSGKSINIPYAYADLRFNPAFDRKTGFFTRSILCVPDRQQGRQDDRGDAGAQQARRPVQAGGRVAPARLHGADLDLAGERQALRRRPEHEELQRGDARVDVQRRGHARRRRQGSPPATRRACASCGRAPEEILHREAAEVFGAGNAWILEKIAQRGGHRADRGHHGRGDDVRGRAHLGQPHGAAAVARPTRSASARCC